MLTKAKWITTNLLPDMMPANGQKINQSLYFRKEFTIDSPVKSAELWVCALGLGVTQVNGKPVTDDVLTTPFTHYDKRVIYQTYDITGLVCVGDNAIGVHVGNGFYNDNMSTWNDVMASWRDKPKLIVAVKITCEGGTEQLILSDSSWRVTLGACVYNHMRQGEFYDARLEQPGYDTAGYDDSNWENAVNAQPPGGILQTRELTPVRIIDVLEPVSVKEGIYDFGVNISGWAEIEVSGEAGQEIRLSYTDLINPDGSLNTNCTAFTYLEKMSLHNEDVFVCSGREREVFHPSFCYHGFRYVKVTGAPQNFKIKAHIVHSDLKRIGTFTSSDEMLNKIHEASLRSTLSNFVGIPTDCPHREQNGWTGDALISADQSLMNFDMYNAYAKWLADFEDAQRANGQLPGIIPSAGWGYNWGSGPAWDSALILIPYKVYLHTGKTDIIKDLWHVMVRYMEYMESRAEDYIVEFGLGDWCPPKGTKMCPASVTDTAYFYANCIAMSKMAVLIGEDFFSWSGKASAIRHAWRERFWNDSQYHSYQTFLACAIYQGMLDPEEIQPAADSLAHLVEENDYHIDCGILGAKYIFSALSENNHADVIYKMITNPTAPSYAYWINCGMTTLCESWDMDSSYNHHMFSEVDNWFYTCLGGIRHTKDGIVIDPVYIADVEDVLVEYKDIHVERHGRRVTVSTETPVRLKLGDKYIESALGNYEFEI